MPSIKSRLIAFFLSTLGAKKMFDGFVATADDPAAFQAAILKARSNGGMSSPGPPPKLSQKYAIETRSIDGFSGYLIPSGSGKQVLLYLHGGAYVVNSIRNHWELAEGIASDTGYDLAYFDYPLAPENDCNTAIEKTAKLYDELVDRYGADQIVVMGDSAGGGLAAGLGMYLRDTGRPMPKSMILLYPWLDATVSHPDAKTIEPVEVLLTIDGLRTCGEKYAGALETTHPYVSPYFGSIEGFPPIYILSGTHDILHPEGKAFYETHRATGHAIEFYPYDKMKHGWLLFGMPETTRAVQQIKEIMVK